MILTKKHHYDIIMIEKSKKTIIDEMEDIYILDMTQNDIDVYLIEVKEAVMRDNYKIAENKRRQDNLNLFINYVIDEEKAKNILLGLTATDFSQVLQNEHQGYEYELLYVFGKDVDLLEKIGDGEKTVSLYIKFGSVTTNG